MKPSPQAGGIQPHLEPLSGQLNPGTQQHSRHQPSRRQWLGAAAAVLSVSGLFGVSSLAHAQTADDLFTAVQRDDVSGLILLDLKGVNLNAINPRGQHALHIALQVPALKVADYLAKRPAVNIDERNAKDETPLMLAVLKGHIGLARILIEREADVNKTGWAPLHYAATYGGPVAVEQVKLLLEHHAYIDAESPNGTTPLMMAAQYGSLDVVKLLLEEGADALLTNEQKLNAIHFAQRASRPSVAEVITAHVQKTQPKGTW